MSKQQQHIVFTQPPPFSMDILSPPVWQGPPGQLIPFNPAITSPDGRFGVFGTDSQVLQVTLLPGEQIQAQPGSMIHKADSIEMKTSMGGCFKRCLGGESMFQVIWTNKGQGHADIALAPKYPAKIIPIDLAKNGPITLHPGAYLAHLGNVNITYKFVRNVGAACCGGAGFLLLKVTGNGIVFINGGGTIMEKILAPGEVLQIDTDSLVGFAENCNYSVKMIPGCMNCCCGGQGIFNTQIVGPGLVITESMALGRLKKALAIPSGGNSGGSSGGTAA